MPGGRSSDLLHDVDVRFVSLRRNLPIPAFRDSGVDDHHSTKCSLQMRVQFRNSSTVEGTEFPLSPNPIGKPVGKIAKNCRKSTQESL